MAEKQGVEGENREMDGSEWRLVLALLIQP